MFPFMGGLNGDAFGYDDDDYRHDEPEYSYYSGTTCKYCGKEGLWWEETKWGRRLFGEDGIHKCAQRDLIFSRMCDLINGKWNDYAR